MELAEGPIVFVLLVLMSWDKKENLSTRDYFSFRPVRDGVAYQGAKNNLLGNPLSSSFFISVTGYFKFMSSSKILTISLKDSSGFAGS